MSIRIYKVIMTKNEFKKYVYTFNVSNPNSPLATVQFEGKPIKATDKVLDKIIENMGDDWSFFPYGKRLLYPVKVDMEFAIKFKDRGFRIASSAFHSVRKLDQFLEQLFSNDFISKLKALIHAGWEPRNDLRKITGPQGDVYCFRGSAKADGDYSISLIFKEPEGLWESTFHLYFKSDGTPLFYDYIIKSLSYHKTQPYDTELFKKFINSFKAVTDFKQLKEYEHIKNFVTEVESLSLDELNDQLEFIDITETNTKPKPTLYGTISADLLENYENFGNALVEYCRDELLVNDFDGAINKFNYLNYSTRHHLQKFYDDDLFCYNFITDYLSAPCSEELKSRLKTKKLSPIIVPIKIDKTILDSCSSFELSSMLYYYTSDVVLKFEEGVTSIKDLRLLNMLGARQIIIELPSTLNGEIDLNDIIKNFLTVAPIVNLIIKGNVKLRKWQYNLLKDHIWIE